MSDFKFKRGDILQHKAEAMFTTSDFERSFQARLFVLNFDLDSGRPRYECRIVFDSFKNSRNVFGSTGWFYEIELEPFDKKEQPQ